MYAITNAIGQISGVVEPLIDGSILGLHNHSATETDVIPGQAAWSTIWFLVAGISALCVIAWLAFARGVPLVVARAKRSKTQRKEII